MQKQRHISAVFLVLVTVPLLFIALTEISKWQLKARMQTLLKSGRQTVTLHLRAEEVKWMDKEEILVDGCMFDIKHSELNNGWYTFTGHFDKEETDFVNKQQNTHTTDTLTYNKLIQLFKNLQQQFYPVAENAPAPAGNAMLYAPYQPGAMLIVCCPVPPPPPWS